MDTPTIAFMRGRRKMLVSPHNDVNWLVIYENLDGSKSEHECRYGGGLASIFRQEFEFYGSEYGSDFAVPRGEQADHTRIVSMLSHDELRVFMGWLCHLMEHGDEHLDRLTGAIRRAPNQDAVRKIMDEHEECYELVKLAAATAHECYDALEFTTQEGRNAQHQP